tara:strand:- start:290 stop:946 length:657 start_codon:yes stop_codon:yes gene_type:complete
MNICILTKQKPGVDEIIKYTKSFDVQCEIFYGELGDTFPQKVINNSFDILISYSSPWIIPKKVLIKTRKWNINFHPGPPEYPGIGCFNFALYHKAKIFGSTAHIMNSKVDTGQIIGVNRFPINKHETVETLSKKTYESQLGLYKEIFHFIINNNDLPLSKEVWKRKPYKRSELEELARIDSSMNQNQVNEIIRATYFPGKPAPYIELHGHKFEFNPER